MRIFVAFLLAWIAMPAAGLPPEEIERRRDVTDRARQAMECASVVLSGGNYDPIADIPYTDCECAIDRVAAGRAPPGAKDPVQAAYEECRSERIDRRTASGNQALASDDKPPVLTMDAREQAQESKFSPRAWISRLSLPSWAWVVAPAILVLGVGLILLGRRGRRDDLMGPPRIKRPAADQDLEETS